MKRLAVLALVLALLAGFGRICAGYNALLAGADARETALVEQLAAQQKAGHDAGAAHEQTLQRIVQALSYRYAVAGGTEAGVGNERLYEALLNEAADYSDLLADPRAAWPLRPPIQITSPFGWRLSPFGAWVSWHTGIDLASESRDVLATADGVVAENWPPPDGYWRGHPELGGMIRLAHTDGRETVYGHLAREYVRTGDRVSRGQVIGLVGNTGRSAGRHLHYEVHIDGEAVEPMWRIR